MSTHLSECVWCGTQTGCCSPEHVLSSGQSCCCDEKISQPPIEFCSLEHFLALQMSMANRLSVARDIYPEWFNAKEEITTQEA